jgi:hypothetical protein
MMKIAPIASELARRGEEFEHVLVHTGQHYDRELSEIFLEELGIGEPDFALGVGSGSHAQQTAGVMERLEPVLLETEPNVVLVPGDVNSTLAAALTAALLVLIGHAATCAPSIGRCRRRSTACRRSAVPAALHPLTGGARQPRSPKASAKVPSTTSGTHDRLARRHAERIEEAAP